MSLNPGRHPVDEPVLPGYAFRIFLSPGSASSVTEIRETKKISSKLKRNSFSVKTILIK